MSLGRIYKQGGTPRFKAHLERYRSMLSCNSSRLEFEERIKVISASLSLIFILVVLHSFPVAQAQDYQARELVIELEDGLATDAQLTLPKSGPGPFPGVLLLQGSGTIDMNEYLPPEVTGSDEPSRPFLQIADYLSSRGFAVLRFNKRGVGLNGTILNASIVANSTYHSYKSDAEKALQLLRAQPEVDRSDITLLGHSEGAIIAPRIARQDEGIGKLVLLSAPAGNLRDILQFQLFIRPLLYAEEVMDGDHDGFLSIAEVEATMNKPGESLAPLQAAGLVKWNNSTEEYQWHSAISADPRSNISIKANIEPLIRKQVQQLLSPEVVQASPWLSSYFALNNSTDIIGDVSASILILQGENDTQIPVREARLLDERLKEADHPDHTLIIYPGLGHSFYPSKNWIQPLGPMEEIVLQDMYAWLSNPKRSMREGAG
jgi:alpha-beta hydrolase superfamily lysophospholipase